jgi:hypothetical protein
MFAEAEHNLALTLISMGNFEEAAEAERKAKELGYK